MGLRDTLKLSLGLFIGLSFLVGCDVFVPEKGDLGQPCLGDAASGWSCKAGLICDTAQTTPTCVLNRDGGVEDAGEDDGGLEDGGDQEPIECHANGNLDDGEACDPVSQVFAEGEDCSKYGYDVGELICASGCIVDHGGCYTCGDEKVTGPELCDGLAFSGADCDSETDSVRPFGALSCSDSCLEILTDACYATETCGDEILDAQEQCDQSAPEPKFNLTCESQGFKPGNDVCTNCLLALDQCDQSYRKLEMTGCRGPMQLSMAADENHIYLAHGCANSPDTGGQPRIIRWTKSQTYPSFDDSYTIPQTTLASASAGIVFRTDDTGFLYTASADGAVRSWVRNTSDNAWNIDQIVVDAGTALDLVAYREGGPEGYVLAAAQRNGTPLWVKVGDWTAGAQVEGSHPSAADIRLLAGSGTTADVMALAILSSDNSYYWHIPIDMGSYSSDLPPPGATAMAVKKGTGAEDESLWVSYEYMSNFISYYTIAAEPWSSSAGASDILDPVIAMEFRPPEYDVLVTLGREGGLRSMDTSGEMSDFSSHGGLTPHGNCASMAIDPTGMWMAIWTGACDGSDSLPIWIWNLHLLLD